MEKGEVEEEGVCGSWRRRGGTVCEMEGGVIKWSVGGGRRRNSV